MEPQQPHSNLGLAAIICGVLLGTVAIKMLWQSNEPFPFTDLPKEMQNQIIYFLSLNTTATTLKEAVDTINSLTKVNKELNELLNKPDVCLQIIKHLAIKFNYSDEQVAAELQTKESQRRLELQHQLKLICMNINDLANFDSLYEQGVDLNFTYSTKTPNLFVTPLMIAGWSNILEKLCSMKNKGLDINQRNNNGETAFMMNVNRKSPELSKFSILLNAGADPEIPNNAGLTPLQALQTMQQPGYQQFINHIQKAIARKHGGQ